MKQTNQNAFIRMPKTLIYGAKYRFLSVHAKLLYALIADRASLSLSNEWRDRNGRVFIYFTIREICETLLCAHDKACRVLTELEDFGLIERQKQGHKYEVERMELKVKIAELRERLDNLGTMEHHKEHFLNAIRKFMEMGTLTAPLLRELIDHIDVHETQGTGKNRTQRIVIHYRFIGYIEIPEDIENYYKADTRQGVAVEYITKSA